jgi:hypothetical protein
VAYVLTICAEGVILAPIVMRMAAQDTPGDRA